MRRLIRWAVPMFWFMAAFVVALGPAVACTAGLVPWKVGGLVAFVLGGATSC